MNEQEGTQMNMSTVLQPIVAAVRTQMNELAEIISAKVKPNGFALLVFPLNVQGNMSFISNARRDEMLVAMQEFIDKHKKSDVDGVIPDKPVNLYYEKAERLIKETGNASCSFLQRKLMISYEKAKEVMDLLELYGVVTAPNHVGKREVLKKS